MIQLKSKRELEKMREAGRHVGEILQRLGELAKPGVTTAELDRVAHAEIRARKLESSFLGYAPGDNPPFPAVICASVNEEIVHGIPGGRRLVEGDLLKIDFGAICDGFHADAAITVPIGEVDEESRLLVPRTHEAMMRGAKAVMPGRQINVIAKVIESYAKRFGYGVVRDFTGHGIGTAFHSGLVIPHYDAAPMFDTLIEPGMTFTVEPMLTLGTHEWDSWDDGWTILTKDRRRTAQFEHTLLVTDTGAEILTLP